MTDVEPGRDVVPRCIDRPAVKQPDVPLRLAANVERLQARLSQFDAIDVAEAEWNELIF